MRGYRPHAYSCKGICDLITNRKRLNFGHKPKDRKYIDGGRYCRRCEKFYVIEIVETLDRQLYCPCCSGKTTGRPRNGLNRVYYMRKYRQQLCGKVKEEILIAMAAGKL
jgi:hypothetical protein